jgi:hypothetical protein
MEGFLLGKVRISMEEFKLPQQIDFDKLYERREMLIKDYEDEWRKINFYTNFPIDSVEKIGNFLRKLDITSHGYESIEEVGRSWLWVDCPRENFLFTFSVPIYAKILDCGLEKGNIKVYVKLHKNFRGLSLQTKIYEWYSIVREMRKSPITLKVDADKDFLEFPISVEMNTVKDVEELLRDRVPPHMEIKISLAHEKFGIIDDFYDRFSLSYLISKNKMRAQPFLSAFHKFCSIEEYEKLLMKTTNSQEFEWAVMSLFSLANIPTIWLGRSKKYETIRVNGVTIGGVDGIAFIEYYGYPTLLLINCTSHVIKEEDLGIIFNIKENLIKDLKKLKILPIIVSQRIPSESLRESAKKSGITIIGPKELNDILQDIKNGRSSYEILAKIYAFS